MKNIRLLTIFFVVLCVAFPCSKASPDHTCPLLKPKFMEGFSKVMVQQRKAFLRDSKKLCEDNWLNLTQEVVCFGARDSKFASVVMPFEGFLTSLKLIHMTGHVSCDANAPQHNRKWGCSRSHPTLGRTPFNIVVTAGKHNGILYPINLFMKDSKKESLWYDIPDVDPDALQLVLGDLSYPYYVTSGQELRMWLGKDYQNAGKVEVEGNVCFAVKGWFIY